MRKIPTLFQRDPDDMRRVLPEVTPGCEWVLAGEGVATRKYDGTCVMFDGTDWWARREVKPGKVIPTGFVPVETDENTGKAVGWQPMDQSPFAKFHDEAVRTARKILLLDTFRPGTYELIGPKINGNPEGAWAHWLVCHADAEPIRTPGLDHAELGRFFLKTLADEGIEGLVWHHPDGRMAKLKVRDFNPATTRSPE